MAHLLKDYPKREFLIHGFTEGFALQYEGPDQSYEVQNNKSARENQEWVLKKVMREVKLGRVAGPFNSKPFVNFHVSPLGAVPKKEPGTFRIIHDLSQPKGHSVNDYISDEYATVTYESFDHVLNIIASHGKGALMAKCDVAEAFRIIPVRPQDYHLLGFKLLNLYFYDRVLPMGCRISCKVFEEFSTSLQYIVNNVYQFYAVHHILDDFVCVGKSGSYECMRGLKAILKTAEIVGAPIKAEKTVYPNTRVVIHGIMVDTRKMIITIPKEKVDKALTFIQFLLGKTHARLFEIQRLVGLLNFCCKCIKPGRAFLRRLWDLTCIHDKRKDNNSTVCISSASKQDLLAWQLFLIKFNGVTVLLNEPWLSSDILHLHTDACKTIGFAGVLDNEWFMQTWDTKRKSLNILILEFIPIVIALHLFASKLSNKSIVFHTDNLALVHVINNQTTKCSQTMHLVRKMVVQCLKFNINFHAKHIPGHMNQLADFLSRLKVDFAKQLDPGLIDHPLKIPHTLQPCCLLQAF